MNLAAAESEREMLSLLSARVRDAFVGKPFYVDGALDLVSVCRLLSAAGLTTALVRDHQSGADGTERLGIFTTTDLRDALLRDQPPQILAVRDVAQFDLTEIRADAELFEALSLMVSCGLHRLIVRDGAQILGVLDPLDVVSFVANHSHSIALQIDPATSVAELKVASVRIDELVQLLQGSGFRIDRITRLVSALNTRLVKRLWRLLAPVELVENSCLLLMGSEGRGEQILKTDQDNALLLRDDYTCAKLNEITANFTSALVELGYPRCPGGIMLSNPLWCQPLATFKETIRGWLYPQLNSAPTDDGSMHLAIFFDAVAVAGDASLLQHSREHLDKLLARDDACLARFAAAADQFDEPGNWFTRLSSRRDEQSLDLKKLGVFPIVHGVRALSLQYGVREQGTAARLSVLTGQQRLDAPMARDLLDALHLLMGLRLTHQLRQRERGEVIGNEVRLGELGILEREALRDALSIVKRFRQFLRRHYKFDAL